MSRLDQLRRRQIEESLVRLEPLRGLERPKGGWIKTIRNALGMSMRQLARRIGVSQSMVSQYERSEVEDSITLGTLRRVADALNCDVLYVLAPRDRLDTIIENQARRVARDRLRKVDHSMAIEGQSVGDEEFERQIEEYLGRLLQRGLRPIWEE